MASSAARPARRPRTRHEATRAVPVDRPGEGPGADHVAVEEPLEIRVEGEPAAITLRTPGHDLDLAVGFLRTEGVIDAIDDIHAIAEVAENTVDVRLAAGVSRERARSADRRLYVNSSCGVCGTASLERLARTGPPIRAWQPDDAVLRALPEALRRAQPAFDVTGGLHAAALFDGAGRLAAAREDVGRHNAVDKVIGAWVREDGDWDGLGLVTSSRAGFEIVQKAWIVGIPVVATVGAPTSLAVDAARRAGIRLVGWLRGERWTVYAG